MNISCRSKEAPYGAAPSYRLLGFQSKVRATGIPKSRRYFWIPVGAFRQNLPFWDKVPNWGGVLIRGPAFGF